MLLARSGARRGSWSGRRASRAARRARAQTMAHAGAPRLSSERSSSRACRRAASRFIAQASATSCSPGVRRGAPPLGAERRAAARPARAASATAPAAPRAASRTSRAVCRVVSPRRVTTCATASWLQRCNRANSTAAVADTSPSRTFARQLVRQALGQRQPAAHPALVPRQQLRDLRLVELVVPVQRAHQPGLLEVGQARAGVAAQEPHLRARRVERVHLDSQLRPRQRPRRTHAA